MTTKQITEAEIRTGRELSKRAKQITMSKEFRDNRHLNHAEAREALLGIGKQLHDLGFNGAFDKRLELPSRFNSPLGLKR